VALSISSSWITFLEFLCCRGLSQALVLSSWQERVNVLAVLDKPLKNAAQFPPVQSCLLHNPHRALVFPERTRTPSRMVVSMRLDFYTSITFAPALVSMKRAPLRERE
jgi:hypothetical protein